jgi:hypothetical protein
MLSLPQFKVKFPLQECYLFYSGWSNEHQKLRLSCQLKNSLKLTLPVTTQPCLSLVELAGKLSKLPFLVHRCFCHLILAEARPAPGRSQENGIGAVLQSRHKGLPTSFLAFLISFGKRKRLLPAFKKATGLIRPKKRPNPPPCSVLVSGS